MTYKVTWQVCCYGHRGLMACLVQVLFVAMLSNSINVHLLLVGIGFVPLAGSQEVRSHACLSMP